MATTLSPDSPAALRDRLADLAAEYQRLIVHGDLVSRADCRAEIEKLQVQLRGAPSAPQRKDEAFFGRAAEKAAPVDRMAELRAIAEDAKRRGLMRGPDDARPVEKDGRDVTSQHLGIRTQWIEIDPARAQLWLENNFRNRPVSEDVVAAYARDMTNGAWTSTHQGIAFNDRDELIDGQHRLLAIVRSGVTVRMMVTFGLPSKIEGKEMTTMDAVDRGRTRSVADQLKIQHGFKDGAATAAICASIGSLCFGERTRRLSVGQTLEIFREFEAAITWVLAHRSKQPGFKQAGVLAAFAFAMTTRGSTDTAICGMLEQLVSGDGLKEGSAIGHLRAFLVSDDAKLLMRTHDRGLLELTLQALFLELAGKPISTLESATRGAEHFRMLQKDRVAKVAAMFALPKAQ